MTTLADAAQAIETLTSAVEGRLPVISNVAITNHTNFGNAPLVGHTLAAAYSFSDPDLDIESGTTIQWLRGSSAINGAAAWTYTTHPER